MGPESSNVGVISDDAHAAVPGAPLSKEACKASMPREQERGSENQKREGVHVPREQHRYLLQRCPLACPALHLTFQHHSTNCRGFPTYTILCLVSAWKVLSPALHLADAPLRKPFLNFQRLGTLLWGRIPASVYPGNLVHTFSIILV